MTFTKLLLHIPCKRSEISLNITLQCGQSFRWREGEQGHWTGMIKDTVWTLSQDDDQLRCLLHNYDNTAHEHLMDIPIKTEPEVSSQKTNEIEQKCITTDVDMCCKTDPLKNNIRSTRRKRKYSEENYIKPINADCKFLNVSNLTYDSSNIPQKVLTYYTTMLHSYLRLDVSLTDLYSSWSRKDPNFAKIASSFPGIRMLDQPPVENVFSFICSSNNNIVRISQLVEKLCTTFGEAACNVSGVTWHSFPTVHSLTQTGVHDKLRQLGFGYRASYICKSAEMMAQNGGEQWLESLKKLSYESCHAELSKLSGVGPKVADCICLMSMGHLKAIPVDTHVFQIAARDYLPELRSAKTVTARIYKQVSQHFQQLYGDRAGWAHSVLFSADLKKFSKSEETSSKKILKKKACKS